MIDRSDTTGMNPLPPLVNERIIPTDFEAAQNLREEILEYASNSSFAEAELFAIRLAVEEAFANAIKHGNKRDITKNISVSWGYSGGSLSVVICDQGDGFDPGCVPDPTLAENIHLPSGRGLMLIRSYMDEVFFDDRGNQITMIKRRVERD